MSTAVITPPAIAVVTLDEAKRHLREESNDYDDYISALIGAATQSVDGPTGWAGIALITQTLELTTDAFYSSCNTGVELLYRPVQSIASIKYTDSAGVEQTIDPAGYRLLGNCALPAYGATWPTPNSAAGAVRVRYVAGYGDDAEDVPAPIKQAILLHIGHLYQNREAVTDGRTNQPFQVPLAYEALMAPFRVLTL